MNLSSESHALAEKLRFPMKMIGTEIQLMREDRIPVEEKNGFQDIVTKADRHSEERLVALVSEYFPDDGIRGEEGANRESQSGYEWIFDPIDATTDFACGPAFYAISAGRAKNGVAETGAVVLANREFFFANRSEGAFTQVQNCGYRPVRKLFDPPSLRETVIAMDFHRGHENLVLGLREKSRNVLALGAFVYATLLVARGELGAYVNTGASPYDMAASVLIAEEAGCVAARFDGSPIDLRDSKTPVIVAANQAILQEIRGVLELINR